MQHHQHAQRAIGDGEAPIGGRHQRIGADAGHALAYSSALSWRLDSDPICCASSTIRFT